MRGALDRRRQLELSQVVLRRHVVPAHPGCWVTCYTDASFTPKGAGWGVWLRSSHGRVVHRGVCPEYVADSLDAEIAAIFAGLFLARRAWGDAVRGIVVRTDCRNAISFLGPEPLRPRVLRTRPGTVRLREKIHGLAAQHGIALEFKWVKGHQSSDTVPAFLNRTCDRLAGEASHRAPRLGAPTAPERLL